MLTILTISNPTYSIRAKWGTITGTNLVRLSVWMLANINDNTDRYLGLIPHPKNPNCQLSTI